MVGDFFLTTWFLEAMKWIYENVDSVFLTIVISTVVLRCATIFSDIATRKSSAKMAALQPEIDKIKKKYKDDPQRAQAEQQKLMKKRGVSMWGSCLPMLITMPLFFCFIAAFRFWGYESMIKLLVDDNPVQLLQSYRFLWVYNIWQADNGTVPIIMDAATFLKTQDMGNLIYLKDNYEVWDKLVHIGVAAREWTSSVNSSGEVIWTETLRFLNTETAIESYNAAVAPLHALYDGHNNGWFLLPVIAAGTNLLSSWITQKNQPPQTNAQGAQTGKMMMWLFPAMSFFFCLTANSAFAIYWTLSSVMMIIINLILNKKFPRAATALEEKK